MSHETKRVDIGVPENWKLLFDQILAEKRRRLAALKTAREEETIKQ